MGYIVAKRISAIADNCETDGAEARRAQELFRRFHCFSAPQLIRQPCRRLIPRTLVRLGQLRGLIYSSDRGERGAHRTYIHLMETPPLLACDASGKQLYVIGGRYRVTHRGIEG